MGLSEHAVGLSERQSGELQRRAAAAPTLPALHRYTGVLYATLRPGSLPRAQRPRLAVASALFGLLVAGDPIPAYRLRCLDASWARSNGVARDRCADGLWVHRTSEHMLELWPGD